MKAYNHYEENTFFEYPRVFKDHENEIIEIIKNIGTRGAFIMQQDLEEFEKNYQFFLKQNIQSVLLMQQMVWN